MKATNIALTSIIPSPDNPRKHFDAEKLQQLADTIKADGGVLEPIIVRPAPVTRGRPPAEPRFELIDGERRWRAAKLAGIKEIATIVKPMTDAEARRARLLTFDQKVDITPIERAAAYQQQIDAGDSIDTIAKSVGKSVSTIREVLLLARCPAKLAEAVTSGFLPASTAALICRVPTPALRHRVTLHVISHDSWWDRSEPHNSRRNVFQIADTPLSYRDTRTLIRNHCMVELKNAPFDQVDADLVKKAGTCEACPKRAGNLVKEDPEAYADVRADICTDPGCFDAKCAAASELKVAEAKEAGRPVLSPTAAKKVFATHSPSEVDYSAEYIDLDSRTSRHGNAETTYRKLLSAELRNGLAEHVVIAVDPTGRSHDLVPKKQAKAPLKKHGVTVYIPSEGHRNVTPLSKSELEQRQQAQNKEMEIRRHIMRLELATLLQSTTLIFSSRDNPLNRPLAERIMRLLAKRMLPVLGDEGLAICELLDLKTQKGSFFHDTPIFKAVDSTPGFALMKFVVWALAHDVRETGNEVEERELADIFNIDFEAIEKKVRDQYAAAESEAPPTGRKLKPKPMASAHHNNTPSRRKLLTPIASLPLTGEQCERLANLNIRTIGQLYEALEDGANPGLGLDRTRIASLIEDFLS